ncbi:hypothetical protein QBC39DRAFT_383727 [Podospora conica]|nr:hypothetical protein QBC39DRAFT_383727 [Schizothecium conicum]
MRLFNYASAAVLALSFGGADAATAQFYTNADKVAGTAKVGFCPDDNGMGICRILGGPIATCLNFPSGWNDVVSTIDVPWFTGCRFFQHGDCQGAELIFYNNFNTHARLANLKEAVSVDMANWNDRISSFRCNSW